MSETFDTTFSTKESASVGTQGAERIAFQPPYDLKPPNPPDRIFFPSLDQSSPGYDDRVKEGRGEGTDRPLPEAVDALLQEANYLKEVSRLVRRASGDDHILTQAELKKFNPQTPEEISAYVYLKEHFEDLARNDGAKKTISQEDIDCRRKEVAVKALLGLARMDGISELENSTLYNLGEALIPRDAAKAQEVVKELNEQLKEAGINARFELKANVEIEAEIGGGVDHVLYLVKDGTPTIVAKRTVVVMRC